MIQHGMTLIYVLAIARELARDVRFDRLPNARASIFEATDLAAARRCVIDIKGKVACPGIAARRGAAKFSPASLVLRHP